MGCKGFECLNIVVQALHLMHLMHLMHQLLRNSFRSFPIRRWNGWQPQLLVLVL